MTIDRVGTIAAMLGQRIPRNFYAQSVLFDPGATYAQAESFLTTITDNFFQIGEGKI